MRHVLVDMWIGLFFLTLRFIKGGMIMVKVYVKTDEMNRIIEINSDIFLGQDVDGWTLIDEGEGDRYVHAQSNYLTDGLIDSGGLLRWKLGPDDQLILRSEQELAEDMAARPPMVDKLDELQCKLDTLTARLEVQEAYKVRC